MRNRTLTLVAIALFLLITGVPGCRSGETARPETPGEIPEGTFPPSTAAGDPLLGGKILVESVQVPSGKGDKAVFQLKNLAQEDLEFLTGGILFYYNPAPDSVALLASHGTLQAFDLVMGGTRKLEAVYRSHEELKSLELRIEQRETAPGVTYLGGALECTDVLTDEPGQPSRVVYKIRNVSSSSLNSVQYRVVLLKRATGEKLQESRWVSVPGGDDFRPGEERVLTPKFRREFTGYPVAVLLIQQLG